MGKLLPIAGDGPRPLSKVKLLRPSLFFLLSCFPASFLASWLPNSSDPGFLDLPNDVVEVRPLASGELGMEHFAIEGDFKSAATRWNEGESTDAIAEFENLGRRTDGLRRVISDHAILDPDFGFHATLLSKTEPSGSRPGVKLQGGRTSGGTRFRMSTDARSASLR